jgi:hypothetical protein
MSLPRGKTIRCLQAAYFFFATFFLATFFAAFFFAAMSLPPKKEMVGNNLAIDRPLSGFPFETAPAV